MTKYVEIASSLIISAIIIIIVLYTHKLKHRNKAFFYMLLLILVALVSVLIYNYTDMQYLLANPKVLFVLVVLLLFSFLPAIVAKLQTKGQGTPSPSGSPTSKPTESPTKTPTKTPTKPPTPTPGGTKPDPKSFYPLGDPGTTHSQQVQTLKKYYSGSFPSGFDIADPAPNLADYGRSEIQEVFDSLVSRCTTYEVNNFTDLTNSSIVNSLKGFANTCQGDSGATDDRLNLTGASGYRDVINTFKDVFPNASAFTKQAGGIQRKIRGIADIRKGLNTLHDNIKGSSVSNVPKWITNSNSNDPFQLILNIGGDAYHSGSQFKDDGNSLDGSDVLLTAYIIKNLFGSGGKNMVFEDVQGLPNLTWKQYVGLDPVLYDKTKGFGFDINTNYRNPGASSQFWGNNGSASTVSNAYIALSDLLRVQLEILQHDYTNWINIDKIIGMDELYSFFAYGGKFKDVFSTHNRYHDFRKTLRAFVRIVSFYPQALPTLFVPLIYGKDMFAKFSSYGDDTGYAKAFLNDPYYSLKNTEPSDKNSLEYAIYSASKDAQQFLSTSYTDNNGIMLLGTLFFLLGSHNMGPGNHNEPSIFKNNGGTQVFNIKDIPCGSGPSGASNCPSNGDIVSILGKINDCVDGSCAINGKGGLKNNMPTFRDSHKNYASGVRDGAGILDKLKNDQQGKDLYDTIMTVNNDWDALKTYLKAVKFGPETQGNKDNLIYLMSTYVPASDKTEMFDYQYKAYTSPPSYSRQNLSTYSPESCGIFSNNSYPW